MATLLGDMQCWRVVAIEMPIYFQITQGSTQIGLCTRNHAVCFVVTNLAFSSLFQTQNISQVSPLMPAPYTIHTLPLLRWQRLRIICNVVAPQHQVQDPCLQGMLEFGYHLNAVTEHLAACYVEISFSSNLYILSEGQGVEYLKSCMKWQIGHATSYAATVSVSLEKVFDGP